MVGTFISYKHEDAAGYAGRLRESLERRLGAGSDDPSGRTALISRLLTGQSMMLIIDESRKKQNARSEHPIDRDRPRHRLG